MSKRVLIVGAGFYGAVCARELSDAGHEVLVLEKRDHIGGNCYTRACEEAACHEHVYGAHIFHTSDADTWAYVNRFARFNAYTCHRVRVRHAGRIYSFPVNLMTLQQVWGVGTPEEARVRLEAVREPIAAPRNMEEWCLANVGRELYELFFAGYTRKQWNRDPKELPADLIRRLPLRLTFNESYYNDRFQGIPEGGYTALFERLLAGIPVELSADFLPQRDELLKRFDHVIYTGPVDAFFGYDEGVLEYRSLRFERELLDTPDFQGNSVVNYTEESVPYTRILEHKHFDLSYSARKTLITREYPQDWSPGMTEFYPVGREENLARYRRYRERAAREVPQVHFGGRLGSYRYYDMHQVIAAARHDVAGLVEAWR